MAYSHTGPVFQRNCFFKITEELLLFTEIKAR